MAGILDYSRQNPWVGDSLQTLSQVLLALGTKEPALLNAIPQMLANRGQQRFENNRQTRQDERTQKLFDMQVAEQERTLNKEKAAGQAFQGLLGGVQPPNGMSQAQFGGAPTSQGILSGYSPEQQSFLKSYGATDPMGAMGMVGEDLFRAPKNDAPVVKDFYEGGTVTQKQWDPSTRSWQELGAGPRWAPDQQSGPDSPSSVREWEYFNSLPEDQKQQYLIMKRAADWQNLGGSVALPNPLAPAGPPIADMTKTLPPQDTPETRGNQAAAVSAAQNAADAVAAANKKDLQAATTLDVLEGVEDLIDKSTGSDIGAIVDRGAAAFGKSTEGAKASAQLKVLQSKLMLSMPRMEGPQSDRDVNLYRDAAGQLGDPTIPRDVKKAAVETIRALQRKYPTTVSPSMKSKYGLD